MRILLFALTVFVATVGIERSAEAQNYPYCAMGSGIDGVNCGFTSFEQCMTYVTGLGGFCEKNNQYQPATTPTHRVQRKSRRHS